MTDMIEGGDPERVSADGFLGERIETEPVHGLSLHSEVSLVPVSGEGAQAVEPVPRLSLRTKLLMIILLA
jgi:hypothetical protein